MIDGCDLISLETAVRSHIGEATANLWTQANVFAAINAEKTRLCRKIITLDNGWLEQTYTTSPADTVSLPTNAYIVRNVELYLNGAWMQPDYIRDHQRGQHQVVGGGTNYPSAWQFTNHSIVFVSGYGGATSLRVRYARMPSDMQYVTLSSGSATTAVLPSGSVLDDAYIDDQIVVLAGTGIGQVSTVTDYVASTKTLTIASGATLDSTTVISWLLPEPLAQWRDLVALGAAIRLLPRSRDNDRLGMLRQDYERDYNDMLESLQQRQTEQAERGNYIPQEDD